MIEIDGSHGEGGGQIIRTALALALLTQQPFHAVRIRKGRPEPGLKAQHLACIKAIQKLSQSKAEGAALGSEELTFYPAPIRAKGITINIGTAGSSTLLLQAVLLPCLFAGNPVRMTVIGGTDVKWATPIDHFSRVLLPHLQRFAAIGLRVEKRGYYPRGGGEIELSIRPKVTINQGGRFNGDALLRAVGRVAPPYSLAVQGKLLSINGISHASRELAKAQVAERQASAAKSPLGAFDCPIRIRSEYHETASIGSGITLWAAFDSGAVIGADALGEKSISSEQVGQAAAKSLKEGIASGAAVDAHTADQLVPFLALAGGRMRTSAITPHARSNIYAIEKFLGRVLSVDEGACAIKSIAL